ncbi:MULTISPECIES: YqgQ family protein [Enterococcaceae]|uniref:Cytosolic protein n=2 Tax=Vagococcus TaxID=2737 RepID=A0A429ZG66_9ENTE|nr:MULTISPECIES: YqgQ family protein [Enterococcaceae]MCI0129657.1 YqgQ family protein [Vagococcus sp. CY53-2]RGI31820.1 DUF910 family protein [Melissococcus sp. OM08-11BH]RST92708.1 hypothetical protein CBF36_08405 [Vagococcus bubulae]UNM90300.1 YqgQ family protein [Vagococcus sp. CY52-2]
MRTMYDVQQLFKRFGIFIYVGNRLWDIELMMIELKQLEEAGLIDKQEYVKAMLVLKHEHHLEEDYQEGQ